MSSFYVPVRFAQMIISGILFILAIIELVHELDVTFRDNTSLAYLGITIIVLFLGVWGSYRHDRSYLLTFALIMIIAIIVGFFSKSIFYLGLGTSILLVILSLTQAELIKRGYH